MTLSSQRYQIPQILREKQIHLSHHGHVTQGQQPQNEQKSAIGSAASIDQHKTFFPLIPKLIGSLSKIFPLITSSLRD